MGILGGSLLQVVAPVVGGFMFLRQRDYFAIAVAFAWLGTSLFDVATYMADARTLSLDLVSPLGGDPIHDWEFLFGRMGLLVHDRTIAFLTRVAATLSMVVALAGGGWLVREMARCRAGAGRP
jgi:hypothetical protein